jgi:glycosyltransferase involved in cell wall biosynthesis
MNDLCFLEKKYNVITQDLDWGSPLKLPFNLMRQLCFLLINIHKTTSILVNFGGYFSLLPVLVGKFFNIKTFIILNGTDCVSFPTYNYGSLRKPILRFFIKKSYQNATKLLPVDTSLLFQKYTYTDAVIYKKQGIKAFFPYLKTPSRVIPNGFDTSFWKPKKQLKTGFLTVANVNNMNILKVKGIDLVLKVAAYFPEEIFTIIGLTKNIENQLDTIPENVKIIYFLEKHTLKEYYQKHLFYMQISINEGFGCALSEAMLCGCIPIISNVGALPNVTNGIGFKIDKKNIETVVSVLKNAIKLSPEEKITILKNANERICDNFDISVRERLLLEEIEN